MKFKISELLYQTQDGFDDVSCAVPAELDRAAEDRIKAAVLDKIAAKKARRVYQLRRTVRTAVLIAAVMLLLSATAYAVSAFFRMNAEEVRGDELISGTWTERDEQGNVDYVQTYSFEDAGIVFSFEGGSPPLCFQFRPGWLPSQATHSSSGNCDEGWYNYMVDEGSGESNDIPYVIAFCYARPGFQLVLNGNCEIVKQEEQKNFQVTEIAVDWTGDPYHDYGENYVVMFNEEEGYMLYVGGASDMETLERIAFNLEVRQTEIPYEPNPDYAIGTMNIGRG